MFKESTSVRQRRDTISVERFQILLAVSNLIGSVGSRTQIPAFDMERQQLATRVGFLNNFWLAESKQ